MASRGILFIIFTVLCITAVKSGGFISLEHNDKIVGHYGQQSLLKCVVQTSKDVQDPSIHVVAWKKVSSRDDENGQIMLSYNKGELKARPGYKFAEPSWNEKNMNVSLLITNTAVTDKGLYSCMVITDSGDHSSLTTLEVQAKYSAPTVRSIPEKIVPNEDSELICESHGGYPKGELRWFDEQSNDWTKSSQMDVKKTPSGLFQLTSSLDLKRGSTFSKYTCVVYNASGLKEGEITLDMPPSRLVNPEERSAETSKIVAPLVVIGSLITGLLCVLIYRRRTRSHNGRHVVDTSEQDLEAAGDQSDEKESQS